MEINVLTKFDMVDEYLIILQILYEIWIVIKIDSPIREAKAYRQEIVHENIRICLNQKTSKRSIMMPALFLASLSQFLSRRLVF